MEYRPEGTRHELVHHVTRYLYITIGYWDVIYLGANEHIRERLPQAHKTVLFLFGSFFIMGLYHIFFCIFRSR